MASSERDLDELRISFMKVYNNLPLKEREETVLVIDDEPVSWKYAHREISADTDMGRHMLEKLDKLDII
ncbi:MAG: hypothetical protein SVV03_06560 [Candidatus Nanohaloarchaea archaeon]|nr:hypothetical protein [Candidatus Nanohaloarchaea archaeon]